MIEYIATICFYH